MALNQTFLVKPKSELLLNFPKMLLAAEICGFNLNRDRINSKPQ